MTEKKAYTPTEFAALFSKEKTWSYRLLYSGKIEGITEYGRIMIPASEADRIASESGPYQVKKKVAKKAAKKAPKSGDKQWSKWVEARTKSSRQAPAPQGRRRAMRLPKPLLDQDEKKKPRKGE